MNLMFSSPKANYKMILSSKLNNYKLIGANDTSAHKS